MTRPRILLIDPSTVGERAEKTVAEHAARLCSQLSVPIPTPQRKSLLSANVASACEYAQKGITEASRATHEYEFESLLVILNTLFGSAQLPWKPDVGILPSSISLDDLDDVELVLVSAWVRYCIETGRQVHCVALAAFADVNQRTMRRDIADGKLKAFGPTRWPGRSVEPDDARAWLKLRAPDLGL